MTALSASPFRTRLFEASSWTPELRREAAQYAFDNLDKFGVQNLYELVWRDLPDSVLLKREVIDEIIGGTTPGIFLGYWIVLHARGTNHVLGTSYHHDQRMKREEKECAANRKIVFTPDGIRIA
jgi:hypothetical protein